ncbi:ArsS family sensor histidine kinase [Campylobacter helveticus]|uniref:histidine kinase n=3 Tax=Campylobacter helveticus TaxID=28898 RepID=A0AAX2UKN6_9BACT|nr:ArsS family sensor histidine kinase [Campylobacter helveticus]MCR2039809.1 ArsS family sensor histidine kinase [Campylobacter helveticus]MCR2054339.1 ArsS family sensor histidine kinase [Campylobacter helveticus]MCR2057151.1 ArsS family sensor histidine kinase [Campylobacter helveticus]MCR2059862.1 ArsS family sensor histidine kinase [Campylobacter helveticus]MCR2062942.1 ArsS family sensor histidine kinase [Campylobacter helveticus]
MNRSSIFYTITFIFLFAGVSVTLGFLWLMAYDQQNYTRELNAKYSLIANVKLLQLNGMINEKEFEEQTKNYNQMIKIDDVKELQAITKQGEILEKVAVDKGRVEIISYKDEIYLNIVYNEEIYLYKDQEYQTYRYFIIKAIGAAVFVVLILLYFFILRKLKPLRTLKKQIDKFAQGKLNEIEDVSTGNDEISQVAEAFHRAILQIIKLNQSRQFFLRNIMHELKTPITKGLITLEMLEDDKYKERLEGIFNRLEILINEFAAIEQITSGAAFINRKKYNILDILDEAKEISMRDENNIRVFMGESFFVNVDFKLFTTAIKNMIDNGIKHSLDGFVQIDIMEDYICFKNRGNELNNTLEYYTQAFTQGSKQKSSFGLGLYIVNTILESHNMKLDYAYEDGINLFYFRGLKRIVLSDA